MLFGNYTFSCRFEDDAVLPAYKGSTIRGLFGHALKQTVCALKLQDCRDCLLRKKCLHSLVFETPVALEMPKGSRISDPPHPFVIQAPDSEKTRFIQGDRLDCGLLLFGDFNYQLPYFIYAFDRMGKIGFGKHTGSSRGLFSLEEVRSDGKRIYAGNGQMANLDGSVQDLSLPDPIQPAVRFSGVRVDLKTPLRFKMEGKLSDGLPFHVLVRLMLRRISSLESVYGRGEPPLDYRGLVERAKEIRIVESRLSWADWRRYSNRQEAAMQMGGITGSVVYGGDLREYMPLLEFCSMVHLGKQTSFGLGKLAYTENRSDERKSNGLQTA